MVGLGAARASVATSFRPQAAAGLLKQLGQPTWQPGSPAGWDDIAASWAAPEALVRRVEVGAADRRRAPASTVDARALAEKLFPGSLSDGDANRDRPRRKPGRRARSAARQPRIREEMNMLSRRSFIAAGGAAAALATLGFPRMAFARAATDRRFVFIIQRGAADGLHIVAPTGDPAYRRPARRLRAGSRRRAPSSAPSSRSIRRWPRRRSCTRRRQALFVHAVASPYRDRSHFDGQNVLETGGSAAYRLRDGWMNRLLGLLPADEAKALALSTTVPMALRGRS